MKIAAFAKKFGMDEDEMIEVLTDNKYLKKNGEPTKKGEDFIDEDGEDIEDWKGLKEELDDLLSEDDEEDEDNSEDEDEYDETDNEEDSEDDEELDFDTLMNTVEDFEFDNKEDLGEMAKKLIDKLVDFEESDDDSDNDDEDEDEEYDEDPNEPGKYRGWTITKEGIKIIAKKGKQILSTSVKGNIRNKIDDYED